MTTTNKLLIVAAAGLALLFLAYANLQLYGISFKLSTVSAETMSIDSELRFAVENGPLQTWEYAVVSIPDHEWEEKAADLGNGRWEVVSARRAVGEDDKPLYELIVKRPVLKGR